MAVETFTTAGNHQIAISGKKSFSYQLWGAGGSGAGGLAFDANGGGGGGGYASGNISDSVFTGRTDLIISLGAANNYTSLKVDDPENDPFLSIVSGSVGGDGAGGAGGAIETNDIGAIGQTGGDGADTGGAITGGGGGGAAGDSADGDGGSAGTGGAGNGGGGSGGNGGVLLDDGLPGTAPGGGGGGAGDTAAAGGVGATGKGIITYTVVTTPVITSNGGGATASVNVVEGNTAVTTVTATGTSPLTVSISGGADAAKFGVTGAALAFLSAPDYENPTDANTDNAYVVIVKVSNFDASGNEFSDTQTITVTVTNDAADDVVASRRMNSSFILGNSLAVYG